MVCGSVMCGSVVCGSVVKVCGIGAAVAAICLQRFVSAVMAGKRQVWSGVGDAEQIERTDGLLLAYTLLHKSAPPPPLHPYLAVRSSSDNNSGNSVI